MTAFQEIWNPWLIGPFLWLAGISGMTAVAYVLLKWSGVEEKRRELSWVTFISLALALVFVVADLSRPWNMPSAIMLILALLVVAIWALPYLVRRIQAALPQPLAKPLAPLLALLDKIATWLLAQRWYYYLAMAIGVLVTLYSGFLISEAKAVPFWNTTLWGIPGIPTIWIFSATAGALALIRMYHLDREHLVHTTEKYGVLFEIGEVAVIFLFLYNALNSASFAARESAHAVLWGELAPIFWVFVIGLGIVTPLATAALSKIRHSPKLTYAGCVAGLFGALALRTLVVYAGIPEPL